MKLLTILTPALLAATSAYAEDIDSSSSSPGASESTKKPDPTPIGALWTPKWTSESLGSYSRHCHSTHTFPASIFALKNLYPTLKDYAPQLKVFYNRQHYPGSWNGEDKHGDKRELLKMEYEDLPFGVREWIVKNGGGGEGDDGVGKPGSQRWFSVQDGTVFFAPGVLYKLLPLWVDESDERGCEGVFDNLDDYSPEAKDQAVLGKVEYKSTGKNEVEVTVEAFQVRERQSGREKDGEAKDEL